MARSRFPSAVRGRGPKRLTDWSISMSATAFVNVPAASKVLLTSVPAASLDVISPATLIRTRGYFSIASDQGAASEEQIGGLGLAFVNETARALGVTAIPGPQTDNNFDGWIVYRSFAQQILFGDASGRQPNMVPFTYEVDSKAMRKFEGSVGLVLVVENIHATHGFEIALDFRMLVKAG